MNAKRRNRIVYFRVSDDEYVALEDACASKGAHTISEFARAAVLQYAQDSLARNSSNQVLRHIEEILTNISRDVHLITSTARDHTEHPSSETNTAS